MNSTKNINNEDMLVPLTPTEKEIVLDHIAWKKHINNLWQSFKNTPYPEEAHIDGLDLELLDTEAAGCISSFITNSGKLDTVKIGILNKCIIDLYKFDIYPSQATKDYFQLLIAVSELALQESVKMYLYKIAKGFSKRWVIDENKYIEDDGFYTIDGLFRVFSKYFTEQIDNISDEKLNDLFSNIEVWIIDDKNNCNSLGNVVQKNFLEVIEGNEIKQKIKHFMGPKTQTYFSQ